MDRLNENPFFKEFKRTPLSKELVSLLLLFQYHFSLMFVSRNIYEATGDSLLKELIKSK